MTGGGRSGFWYAAGAAVCVGVAVAFGWGQLPRAQVGQVDPASLVVALAALAVALWSGRQAVRVARSTPVPVADVAARLADEVRKREQAARAQLLGGRGRTIDVDFDFRPAPAHDARNAGPVGSLEQVVAYYQALAPQRLVITGAPGAGKTVLALELLDGLLDVREPDDPVPVRIPAAAWDTTHPLRDWLARHLVDAYGLPERAARAVMDAGLVMPVIDGLDEMDATPTPGYTSRAAAAVRALNAYQHGRHAAPLVLTCRTTHYQALTNINVWTHDAAHIAIRPVTDTQAERFIRSRVDSPARWEPVLRTITHHPGGPLAVALSTPWRLSLATTVYEQRDPDTGAYLREPADLIKIAAASGSSDAVRDHLLDHFVPATTATVTDQRYTAEQVQRWLGVLAAHLDHNATTRATLGGVPLSGTDLVLHHLWPLAGINRVRLAILAMLALIWLVATPVLLVQSDIGFSPAQILGAVVPALVVAYMAHNSWVELWPTPCYIDLPQLRSKKGRRQLAGEVAFGLAFGLAGGLAVGLVVGFAVGLTGGLVVGLTGGLAVGLDGEQSSRTWDPRRIIRSDLVVGLAFGLVVGLVVGVAVGLAGGLARGLAGGLTFGLAFGVAVGFTFGLTGGLTGGLAGVRYVAMLVCTRPPFMKQLLPWQLGRFLHWCYEAGLIRQAGIGYQFRHRELQDHLARTHTRLTPGAHPAPPADRFSTSPGQTERGTDLADPDTRPGR